MEFLLVPGVWLSTDMGILKTIVTLLLNLLICHLLAGQQIVWEKELRLSTRDLFYTGIQTYDSHFILGGESGRWRGHIGATTIQGACVAKIDSFGDTVWVRPLGQLGKVFKIIRSPIPGQFFAVLNYYLGNFNPKTMIMAIDDNGNILNQISLPPSNQEQLAFTAIYHNNHIFLAGRQYPGNAPNSFYEMWAAKIEPNTGTVVWSRTYNLNHPVCVANSIEPTPYGTYMLGGYQGSRIVNIEITTNGVMIDNQMLYQNQNNIVFESGAVGQIGRTHFVANGNFRFNNQARSYFGVHSRPGNQRRWGGESLGYGTKPLINADSTIIYQVGTAQVDNVFIGRLDLDSNYFWRISTNNSTIQGIRGFYDIIYNEDETGILLGSIRKTTVPVGTSFYMAKFTGIGRPFDPTGVHHPHLTEKQGGIYPNPVKDFFRFRKQYQKGEVIFYQTSGKEVYRCSPTNNQPISLAHLRSGVYIYRCQLDGKPYHGKLVKE